MGVTVVTEVSKYSLQKEKDYLICCEKVMTKTNYYLTTTLPSIGCSLLPGTAGKREVRNFKENMPSSVKSTTSRNRNVVNNVVTGSTASASSRNC